MAMGMGGAWLWGDAALTETRVRVRGRRKKDEDLPQSVATIEPEVNTEDLNPLVLERALAVTEALLRCYPETPGAPDGGVAVQPEAVTRFTERHRRLAIKRGLECARPRIVYHWTRAEHFESITRTGLRVPDGQTVKIKHGSSFGNGIYCSPEFRYGREMFSYGTDCAFICLVLPGKQLFGKPPADGSGFDASGDEGWDSSVGREGQRGVDEWILFRNDQVLTCFLVDQLGTLAAKDALHHAIKILNQPWPAEATQADFPKQPVELGEAERPEPQGHEGVSRWRRRDRRAPQETLPVASESRDALEAGHSRPCTSTEQADPRRRWDRS